jgi:hypothetical protein
MTVVNKDCQQRLSTKIVNKDIVTCPTVFQPTTTSEFGYEDPGRSA